MLTDDKIIRLAGIHLKYQIEGIESNGAVDFARAIIATTVDKLAAGVSVEPEIKENQDGND